MIAGEEFREVSVEAKILYGLMLDRLSLSMKNGWFDDQNRAYIIYTVEHIMSDLQCGNQKAVKTDKAHIHNHIIFSSIDLDNTRKFKNFFSLALPCSDSQTFSALRMATVSSRENHTQSGTREQRTQSGIPSAVNWRQRSQRF